jgi:hypothetical protein
MLCGGPSAATPTLDRLGRSRSPSVRPKAHARLLSGEKPGGAAAPTLERVRPDIRPQLREFLAWYEEVLGRIESGAVVAPGEQERLTEEASAVAHLLDLLDSSADEPAS